MKERFKGTGKWNFHPDRAGATSTGFVSPVFAGKVAQVKRMSFSGNWFDRGKRRDEVNFGKVNFSRE